MVPYDDFVERVISRGGFTRREDAVAAVEATLVVLRARLSDEEIAALTIDLPGLVARLLRYGEYEGEFELEELYDRVRRREGVSAGHAREHTQVVCRVLAESLPESARERLKSCVRGPIAGLFALPPEPPPPSRRERQHRNGSSAARSHTLAEGRPGSEHPLSEAKPETAHTHSVVREENPHGDTKVSSARRTTRSG